MGNTTTSSTQAPSHILPPDYLLPCRLGRADVVFAPIGRLGAGRIITRLAYDIENRIIAAGTISGLVILVCEKDLQTTLRPPDGHAVDELSFLCDNRLFVSFGDCIEIWNWATGSVLLQIEMSLSCFAIYEKRFVIFGTDGGCVEVLDVDNGRLSEYTIQPANPEDLPRLDLSESATCQVELRGNFEFLGSNVEVIDLALDNEDLYIALSNSSIRVYDLKAQQDKLWLASPDAISLLSIEPSTSDRRGPPRIAFAGGSGGVRLWDQQSSSQFGHLIPTGSEEGIEPVCQVEWIASDKMAVLSGATSQTMSVFSLPDCTLLSSFPCSVHQFLLIPSSAPMTFISSSWEGELFMSQFDPNVRKCTLIPSDFAQCVLFESYSNVASIERWIEVLTAPQSSNPDESFSQFLQGGVLPDSILSRCLLITVSDKKVMSLWDAKSPFSARFLSDLDIFALCELSFADGDDFANVSSIALCSETDYKIALGFSNGCIIVLEHNVERGNPFSIICQVYVHSRPVTLVRLCSKWNRIASADQHSVSLCELSTGRIIFAVQLQQASCLFFSQIESTLETPGEPLRNVLLVGTKKRSLFAFDAINGRCINSEFTAVIDNSPNDILVDKEGDKVGDCSPPSPSFLFEDAVIICGMVDSHGCAIPIQVTTSASKSVYISPRYVVGSWNATLRVCEFLTENSGVRINSLCEIRYPKKILRCWLISISAPQEPRTASAVVTIDSGRRLQIRRLMDINYILLESDIPSDLKTDDIPKCSCTEDGRLSWITRGGEIMTAVLFMDCLRKVQAPMIAPIDRESYSAKPRNSKGLLSTVAKVVQSLSLAELFSQKRVEAPSPEFWGGGAPEANPASANTMALRGKDNLEKVMETAEKTERLSSSAADFSLNAKLFAESKKKSWF